MAEASPPPLLQRPALLRSFAPLDYKGILRHLGIIVVFTLLLPFLLLSLILYAILLGPPALAGWVLSGSEIEIYGGVKVLLKDYIGELYVKSDFAHWLKFKAGKELSSVFARRYSVEASSDSPTCDSDTTLATRSDCLSSSNTSDEGDSYSEDNKTTLVAPMPQKLLELDFTDLKLSPHWSSMVDGGSSPLGFRSRGPSPQRWPSPVISDMATTPTARMVRRPLEVINSLEFNIDAEKESDYFSVNHSPVLRNMKSRNFPDLRPKTQLEEQGEFSPTMDVRIENKSPTSRTDPLGRLTLISKLKDIVGELEDMESKTPMQSMLQYDEDDPFHIYSPPPRPATVPRLRGNFNFDLDRSFNSSPERSSPLRYVSNIYDSGASDSGTRKTSVSAEGLYGADTVDLNYWSGFDDICNPGERSFDSTTTTSEEDIRLWRANTSKWTDKGVEVMKPLDEVSNENSTVDDYSVKSNSNSPQSVKSRKDQWEYDEPSRTGRTESTLSLSTVTASTYKNSVTEYNSTTPESSLRTQYSDPTTPPHRSSAPQSMPVTLSPQNPVVGHVANQMEYNGSPILSPPNPGSGRLIAMFEELNRSKKLALEKKEDETTPPVTPEPKQLEASERNRGGNWSKSLGRLSKYRDRLDFDLGERRRSKSPSSSPVRKDGGHQQSPSPLKNNSGSEFNDSMEEL